MISNVETCDSVCYMKVTCDHWLKMEEYKKDSCIWLFKKMSSDDKGMKCCYVIIGKKPRK
jgi:hypothetical protein